MLQRCSGLLAASLLLAAVLALSGETALRAGSHDWPQWQGTHRDGISAETGLLKEWPEKGPPQVWMATGLGRGWSSVAVARGKIYTMGDRNDQTKDAKKSLGGFVICLDEATGKELWSTRVSAPHGDGGPRCTPTVDGDLLYALSPDSDLVCLESATGKLRWEKNLRKDFGGASPGWSYCESPLVDGSKLVCTPGGKKATLVALDKKTGDTIWECPVKEGDTAAHSSIIVGEVNGERQYMQFLSGGVVGVAAKDGAFRWRYNKPANGTANCSTPIYHQGRVFAASGYGTGGGLARLTRDGKETKAEQVYFTKQMKNHHGGMVLVDGYLYGSDEGQLCCLEFATGKIMWEEGRPGKGSIAYADGRLYYRNEGGPITLVEANPKKYVERGRFEQVKKGDGPTWPHPVLANGKLYLRHGDLLFCYDVKQHGSKE